MKVIFGIEKTPVLEDDKKKDITIVLAGKQYRNASSGLIKLTEDSEDSNASEEALEMTLDDNRSHCYPHLSDGVYAIIAFKKDHTSLFSIEGDKINFYAEDDSEWHDFNVGMVRRVTLIALTVQSVSTWAPYAIFSVLLILAWLGLCWIFAFPPPIGVWGTVIIVLISVFVFWQVFEVWHLFTEKS